MTERRDERREDLPDHEFRDIEREGGVGGGVMSSGGTAIDRGTGTLDGTAQGPHAGEDSGVPGDDDIELVTGRIDDETTADVGERREADPAR